MNEFLKEFQGKMDGFIIYKCRGRTCVRRKPAKEDIAFSPKMREQQERVASIAALHQAMKAVGLDKVWTKAAKRMGLNGYNLLVRKNSPAFSGEGEICDFQKLLLTTGRLQLPNRMKLQKDEEEEGRVVITWRNDEDSYPLFNDDDRLMVALMRRSSSFPIKLLEIGEFERKHCRAVIRLPTELKRFHHLYCYFRSANGEESSKSKYFNI